MLSIVMRRISIFLFIFFNGLIIRPYVFADIDDKKLADDDIFLLDTSESSKSKLKIKNIFVEGNKHIRKDQILNRVPYKAGGEFDLSKTRMAIRNLYDLGYFRQIKIESEVVDDQSIDLFVVVEEKKLLERVEFEGNKKIKSKKLKETLKIDKLSTIDEETLQKLSLEIQKAYVEENRHLAKVTPELVFDKNNPDKAVAKFHIQEGPKSRLVRVYFKGNKKMPERKLRNILLTRENWLLNFMDSAGIYKEEFVEMDKHRMEYFYRDHGYLTAKITDAKVEFSRNNRDVKVTYYITEGDLFRVREIHVPGDEIYTESDLLPYISLEKNRPYSQKQLVDSLNRLKDIWGLKGYIYADVYPQVKPDMDAKEVDITFHVERGNKLYVNRINITGNKVTRDKVIRRRLGIFEGDLITTQGLKGSQNNVENLSFFEKDSVNWKIHRISDSLADIEMNVKEAKTGNANFMLTYGSDRYNPRPSLRGAITIDKSNLFGCGYDWGAMIQASRHRVQKLETHFTNPHIFDSNVSGAISLYKRWDEYEFWRNVDKTPVQNVLGVNAQFGLWLPAIDRQLQLVIDLGIESIRNNKPKSTDIRFEPIVRRSFQEGTLKWIGIGFIKDTRNHQVYPSSGYRVMFSNKFAPSVFNHQFSFFKTELEASSYTALIGDDDLVLGVHGKVGHVHTLNTKKIIPYKELFHMGGQTTVRGFVWGGIGPAWITGDPLGGRNMAQFNSELIFPLIPDYSMKAHFFYDAGTGWDTPKNDINDPSLIKRDQFDVRHSVGFGLNLIKPMPAKIDWGFKLDRRKRDGESVHEFHLSMNYAW